jgi:hypothetical protein
VRSWQNKQTDHFMKLLKMYYLLKHYLQIWQHLLIKLWIFFKQWPLAPNSQEWQITRANVSRRVTFFSKMAFGECPRVWRVRATRLGECRRVWRVRATRLGECRRVWRVRATRHGECRQVWQVRATRLGASVHDKIGCFKHKLHILYA